MSEQFKSNLENILDYLGVDNDEQTKEKIGTLLNEKVILLLVGATGSGKNSTINAMFNTEFAKVGIGADPETSCIEQYELDGLTIWDTPGMGDGVERDIEIATAIKSKLDDTDDKERQLIDMALIVPDASTKDLSNIYTLINEVLFPGFGDEAEKRIVIGLNQSDMAMKGRHWDSEKNEPDQTLKDSLDSKATSVSQRIQENTGLSLKTVCYCAGYSDEDERRDPYNLTKLLQFILSHTPEEKRLVLAENLNENEENWKHNGDDSGTLGDFLFWVWLGIAAGVDTGREVGKKVLGLPGLALGGILGAAIGTVGGVVDYIQDFVI